MSKLFEAVELMLRRPSPHEVRRIQFAVTYLCDCKCSMCNIWKSGIDKAKEEITLDQIVSAFSNPPFLNRLSIVDLTGGEPFLRRDFPQICGFFLQAFPQARILITTNGLNTKRILRSTEDIMSVHGGERIELSVSLDGGETTHDALRGRPGAFRAAVETAKNALDAGVGKVTFSFTLVPENADQVIKTYDLARQLGTGFTTVRYAQESFYYDNAGLLKPWTPDRQAAANASIRALIEARRLEGLSLGALRDIRFLERQSVYHPSKERKEVCFSGTHSFCLDPYGNVFPCVMLNRVMGNILENDLAEIWFSEQAKQVRQFIKMKRCSCLTECETLLSMQRDPVEVLRIFSHVVRRAV